MNLENILEIEANKKGFCPFEFEKFYGNCGLDRVHVKDKKFSSFELILNSLDENTLFFFIKEKGKWVVKKEASTSWFEPIYLPGWGKKRYINPGADALGFIYKGVGYAVKINVK